MNLSRENLRKMGEKALTAALNDTRRALKTARGHDATTLAARLRLLESESNRRDAMEAA